MPYIKEEFRQALLDGEITCKNAGELNFYFTSLALQYLQDYKLSYQTINDILGALEGAKQEFYRRIAVPYEESKRRANGDVYPL